MTTPIPTHSRRLRVFRLKVANGEPIVDSSADIWQDEEGHLVTSGIWERLVPVSPADVGLRAKAQGISVLDAIHRRLLGCAVVRVEVID